MATGSRFLLIILAGASSVARAQSTITITTWNIEHLGSSGRGFGGGFGAGSLPMRTTEDLKKIATLIKNDLKADVLALQEIGIGMLEGGRSRSGELNTIVSELGSTWEYFLPPVASIPADDENMFCALLWNAAKVNALDLFVMEVPNHELAGRALFDRRPVVGYFEARKDGVGTNDFILVSVHLASGQDHEENHLIAVTVIEHELNKSLADNEVQESDRIILGDFNDNPFAKTEAGNQKYSPALYAHMAFKGYTDLVSADTGATRMDSNLTSIIDHILVSKSAKLHIPTTQAKKFVPGDSSTFGPWRATFSDHFPLSFEMKVENSDDDVDFD